MPFSFWHLDCDKTRQALLLTRPVESRELASDCNNRRRDRVLNRARSWAAQVRLHRMDIVVVAPSCSILSFDKVCRRCCATSGSRMVLLLTKSKTLNPFPLTASTVTIRRPSDVSLIRLLLFRSDLLRSVST